MASEERQFMILSSESSHSLVEENISMSPNGPFSDLSYGSSYSSASSSDIGSPETVENDEDELILAELTRRMAEFTFQDDDDDEEDVLKRKLAAKSFLQDNYKGGGEGYNPSSGGYNIINQAIKSASKPPTADSDLPRNPSSDIFSRKIYRDGNILLVQKEGAERGGGRVKTADRKDQHHQHHHRNNRMQDKNSWRSSTQGVGGFSNGVSPVNNSDLRTVFLGGSSNNTVSNGTGVFIPGSTLKKTEPKKRSGCSTVLIPARVLQTLQQHFNNVGATSQSQKANDVLARINGLLSQQQEQAVFKIQPPEKIQTTAGNQEEEKSQTTAGNQEELQLPHEWTY